MKFLINLNNIKHFQSVIFLLESTNPDTDVCTSEANEYKEPSSCTSTGDDFDCDYFASWSLDQDSDLIDITLKVGFVYGMISCHCC